jgi:hypothetical protein
MPPRAIQGRRLVALVVLGLALWAGISGYFATVAAGGGDHQTADWLISYPGEFVRRGLFGELLLRLTPPGTATLWILFGIQVICYLAILLYVLWFLERQAWSWSAIALACSPAGLAFIGWDVVGGFRKEVLGFVALVLLAAVRQCTNGLAKAAALVGSVGVWTLAVFSWESIAFMLPAVVFLLLAGTPLPLGRALAGVYSGIALVALGASVAFHGDAQTPIRLCRAVTDHGLSPNLCTGAIAWMGRDLNQSLALVQQNLAVHSGYLAMLLLAALPIVFTGWLRHYWPWALAMVVGIAPLFALGIDYGRWVHILFFELAICMMIASVEEITSKHWTAVSTLLYVGLWGIPHAAPTAATVPGWPFKGLLATLIGWLQSGLLTLS